jgi:hypothetical protein
MSRAAIFLLVAAWVAPLVYGCGGGDSPTAPGPGPEAPGPPPPAIPPAGANFSVSPVPVELIARITPIGYNNWVIPQAHTYWLTCDIDIVLRSTRPCHRERLPLRAPADGTVRDANPAADGFLTVEGPPGLEWTFGHVTLEPGVVAGARVTAGQVVARMFYDHGFDFGMSNRGVHQNFIAPGRYPDGYLHAQHPAEQFAEPLRSEMAARSASLSRPFGGLDYDVPGTTAGAWFIEGTPREISMRGDSEHVRMWLGRWIEREQTRVAAFGFRWPGMVNNIVAADPGAQDWESITPASGIVAVKLWAVGQDALPNLTFPAGTVLVEMPSSTQLRMEWFDTHAGVGAFTPAARMYER